MGLSSSGAAAFTMAWFHPDLYRRVLAYSPTMRTSNGRGIRRCAAAPGNITFVVDGPGRSQPGRQGRRARALGAARRAADPGAPTKPIRYWFEMGDQDLFYPNPTIPDGMHDWTCPPN